MKEVVGLQAKNYLIDDSSEDKEAKGTKKCVIERKLKCEDYENCLEATQLKKNMKHLLKNEIGVDCFKKHHKELLKNNKLIFQTQQRFKSERKNVFNEVISNITLSSNVDKRM